MIHNNIQCSVFGGGIFSRIVQGAIQPLVDLKLDYNNLYLRLKPFSDGDMSRYLPNFRNNMEIYDKPLNYVLDQKFDSSYQKVTLDLVGFSPKIETAEYFQKYREAARKLVIKQSIIDLVDEKLNGINLDKTLGVHVRLTTMNYINKYGIFSIEDYIDRINTQIDKFGYEKICVASDNDESLKKLIDRYGNMIVYNENFNRLETENAESFQHEMDTFFNESHWVEAFVDCIMISRCKSLICRTSNFANMAILMGNHAEIKRLRN